MYKIFKNRKFGAQQAVVNNALFFWRAPATASDLGLNTASGHGLQIRRTRPQKSGATKKSTKKISKNHQNHEEISKKPQILHENQQKARNCSQKWRRKGAGSGAHAQKMPPAPAPTGQIRHHPADAGC